LHVRIGERDPSRNATIAVANAGTRESASLLTVFVPALRKLPAGGRPIMAHTLQLNRFIHQSLCQHKKFVWQTPLIMDTFLQQLLVES